MKIDKHRRSIGITLSIGVVGIALVIFLTGVPRRRAAASCNTPITISTGKVHGNEIPVRVFFTAGSSKCTDGCGFEIFASLITPDEEIRVADSSSNALNFEANCGDEYLIEVQHSAGLSCRAEKEWRADCDAADKTRNSESLLPALLQFSVAAKKDLFWNKLQKTPANSKGVISARALVAKPQPPHPNASGISCPVLYEPGHEKTLFSAGTNICDAVCDENKKTAADCRKYLRTSDTEQVMKMLPFLEDFAKRNNIQCPKNLLDTFDQNQDGNLNGAELGTVLKDPALSDGLNCIGLGGVAQLGSAFAKPIGMSDIRNFFTQNRGTLCKDVPHVSPITPPSRAKCAAALDPLVQLCNQVQDCYPKMCDSANKCSAQESTEPKDDQCTGDTQCAESSSSSSSTGTSSSIPESSVSSTSTSNSSSVDNSSDSTSSRSGGSSNSSVR